MAYRIKDPKLSEMQAVQWTGDTSDADILAVIGEGYDFYSLPDGSLAIESTGDWQADGYEYDSMTLFVPPGWWIVAPWMFQIDKMDPETFDEYVEKCNEQEDR